VSLVAALLACATVLVATAHADPVGAKRAEAERVLAELRQLDASAQRANSRYQIASLKLRRVERSLRINRQALGVARANLGKAQAALAQRLVAIYTTRDEQSTLSVFLGAKSLDDLVSRIETVNSVSRQDADVINEVVSFRKQIVVHRAFLRRAQRQQKHLVLERADAKRRADAQVRHEQNLYQSVKSELQQLLVQQHARELAAARVAAARASAQSAQAVGSSLALPTSVADASAAPPPSPYGGVVGIAMRYLGVPYVWGGASPSGFDCSGFVMYVYSQVGVSLPHYTVAQWNAGVPVSRADLEPGDLVFFDGLGHVGIYVGGGEFIHSPQTGDVVKISSLDEGWYAANYDGARRISG